MQVLNSLLLTIQWCKYNYHHPHLTDKETKAEEDQFPRVTQIIHLCSCSDNQDTCPDPDPVESAHLSCVCAIINYLIICAEESVFFPSNQSQANAFVKKQNELLEKWNTKHRKGKPNFLKIKFKTYKIVLQELHFDLQPGQLYIIVSQGSCSTYADLISKICRPL